MHFINMMTSPALHTRIVLGTGGELHSVLSSAQRFILTYCMMGRVEFIWKGRKHVEVSLSATPNAKRDRLSTMKENANDYGK